MPYISYTWHVVVSSRTVVLAFVELAVNIFIDQLMTLCQSLAEARHCQHSYMVVHKVEKV